MLRVLPPTNQTSVATNQAVASCEKLLQKLEIRVAEFFATKSVYVARFATSDVTDPDPCIV